MSFKTFLCLASSIKASYLIMLTSVPYAYLNYGTKKQKPIKQIKNLKELTKLYPKHIMTEDKKFFMLVTKYFTQAEEQAMINEGLDYDREFIDNEHKELLKSLE